MFLQVLKAIVFNFIPKASYHVFQIRRLLSILPNDLDQRPIGEQSLKGFRAVVVQPRGTE